jgi:predicted membrane protein
MKTLLGDYGFIVSILVAVVIAAIFAFVFHAPLWLVAALLVLGLFTALAEYSLHSRGKSQ